VEGGGRGVEWRVGEELEEDANHFKNIAVVWMNLVFRY
jgi:hypothetical protein